jgi:thermitase
LSPAVRLLGLTVLTLGLCAPAGAATDRASSRGDAVQARLSASAAQYVPGEVIVQFRADASRTAERRANQRVGARVAERFAPLGAQVAKLPPGLSVASAVRRYEADPAVAFAEPNYLRHPALIPSDSRFGDLFGLNNTEQPHPVSESFGSSSPPPTSHVGAPDADIDAAEAWDTQTGDGTPVAVVDTGVDVGHSDFSGQLWINPGEIAGNGIDDDADGHIDDVHGWDVADDDASLLSSNAFFGYDHGTHVAGTIAAALDNTTGVVGVCPDCRIMVLKIARDSDGAMPLSAVLAAIEYAKQHGVRIANMSYAGAQWSNLEREAIRTSGFLAVAAAGNDSLDNDMALATDLDGDGTFDVFSPSYPAAYALPNIITVGASNDEDRNGYSTECAIALSKPRCAFTNWA